MHFYQWVKSSPENCFQKNWTFKPKPFKKSSAWFDFWKEFFIEENNKFVMTKTFYDENVSDGIIRGIRES